MVPFTEWYKVWVLHFSLVTVFIKSILKMFFSLTENFKLKNLLVKVEKVLTFLFLVFLSLV